MLEGEDPCSTGVRAANGPASPVRSRPVGFGNDTGTSVLTSPHTCQRTACWRPEQRRRACLCQWCVLVMLQLRWRALATTEVTPEAQQAEA